MNSKKIKFNDEFSAEVYTFARKLMESITRDIEKGEKVTPSKMYTFTKLLNIISELETNKMEQAEID